jgi:hypothetical protein
MRTLIAVLILSFPIPGQSFELDPAHAAAGVLVLERMKADDPDGYARLLRCPAGSILLIDGEHDHTDRVLRGLSLPWRRCSSRALARASLRGV